MSESLQGPAATALSGPSPKSSPPGRTLLAALQSLWEARRYAQELGCDPWQFAVERQVLRQEGVTNNELRWLLWKEYAVHAEEVTTSRDEQRRFEARPSSALWRNSCFVLTPLGESVAKSLLEGNSHLHSSGHSPSALRRAPEPGGRTPAALVPSWDGDLREIRYGGRIVKQFKVPSPNQELVLTAFEEENWPRRIDDPLPPDGSLDPKQRLHDTIRSLNRNQRNQLMRFMGDGTGEGILWEPYRPIEADAGGE